MDDVSGPGVAAAVVVVDPVGTIVMVNAMTEQLFGQAGKQLLGQNFDTLVAQEDRAAWAARQAPSTLRLQGRRRDGEHFPIEVRLELMAAADGPLTSATIRDLSALSDRNDAGDLEAARFHLAAMIENSGAAIIGAGLDSRITSWNTAAEKLYGYTRAEALGRSGSFLVPPEQETHNESLGVRFRLGEAMAPYDAVRRRKDGTDVDVSISPSLIRDAAGTVVGYSAFVYDISERKRSERALEAAHEATLIASREYEAFAYAVAHDLRTPLRGIDGFIFLGQEHYAAGDLEAARVQMERARASARKMSRLIDSLLRLAQVNRQLLNRTTIDLSTIVASAITRLREESPARSVETVIQPGLSVMGDADLLGIVLTNLVDNSWKFTRHQPQARIEFGYRDDHYFMKDNGAGFDMAHSEKLFGLFQRLHHQNEFEGTGIGLATSQRIIRRHGGRIWADSSVGNGSTFRFTLPLDPATEISG
jgi:PAS domain S-box-containing protein